MFQLEIVTLKLDAFLQFASKLFRLSLGHECWMLLKGVDSWRTFDHERLGQYRCKRWGQSQLPRVVFHLIPRSKVIQSVVMKQLEFFELEIISLLTRFWLSPLQKSFEQHLELIAAVTLASLMCNHQHQQTQSKNLINH